ncbi:MAG: glycoside hydrolase family 88 protein [Opitutaceae bacterium]|nr:glycoside hydrolase family 88 protein [Opitutaceae bacterium]
MVQPARAFRARPPGRCAGAGGAPKARWDYTSGLFAHSLQQLSARGGDASFGEAGNRIVESYIGADGTIATYQIEDYNIDMVTPGRALLTVYEQKPEERSRIALATLRQQLAHQPRTSEGGFWHKLRYPHQMWLDGLYMGSPFLAHYGKVFGEPAAFNDVAKQILLIDAHLYDAKTGLYYHAWDEARKQSWADKTTGLSPNFWGRSIGWYAMAIVDVLDDLPPTQPELEEINAVLRRVADGIVRWQDPKSGLWWQVVDQGAREGNYLEATASSMFVYSLAKAINRGYLPREKYLPVVRRGYEGIIRELMRTDTDGRVSLTRCCSVAGLGFTNAAGRARDGSFEYYISEPVIDNDLKGVGPFILAGLEMQQLLSTTASSVVRGWGDVGAILARIKDPVFPARDFAITDFGAKPGADASGAIRSAIAACNKAGGGRVVVPAGEWLTGAVHLLSNVNLHVSKGATLRFKTDPEAYLPAVFTRWEGMECYNYSPLIYAFEQTDIAVTGEGTLDGAADWDNWWSWNKKRWDRASKEEQESRDPRSFIQTGEPQQRVARNHLFDLAERGVPVTERRFGAGDFLRPNFIQPYRCRNVLIEGVTILRSPMWEVHPVLCTNVTVRGVTVSTHGPNNDGCDPESCRDVLIENCIFDTGDDCIAIKSGRNNDGRRLAVPAENHIVRGCTMKDGHGGVVIGSEISGGYRNLFVEDCTMDSPNLDRALRLKTNASRGGIIENIFFRNVTVGRVAEAVLTIDLLYEEGAKGAFPPTVRNIFIENVTSSASPRVLYVRGFPGATIDNIRFADCTFRGVTKTEVLSGAGTVIFRNVTIEPAQKPAALNSVAPISP